jgi:hypothetical protein
MTTTFENKINNKLQKFYIYTTERSKIPRLSDKKTEGEVLILVSRTGEELIL